MARPTKYTRKLEKTANEYIDGGYLEEGELIPSHMGMAKVLGLAQRTLYAWSADGIGEFSHTLERCMSMQHLVLLNKGLASEFNSNIAKLALSNHGYSEKQWLDHTSSDGTMTPKATGEAVLEALARKHEDS